MPCANPMGGHSAVTGGEEHHIYHLLLFRLRDVDIMMTLTKVKCGYEMLSKVLDELGMGYASNTDMNSAI